MDWEVKDIKDMIISSAKTYWKNCQEDFCIQEDEFPEVMIFGSTNRVVWRFDTGFRIDHSYCTKRFLDDNK